VSDQETSPANIPTNPPKSFRLKLLDSFLYLSDSIQFGGLFAVIPGSQKTNPIRIQSLKFRPLPCGGLTCLAFDVRLSTRFNADENMVIEKAISKSGKDKTVWMRDALIKAAQ
jgi:hypothetical protein